MSYLVFALILTALWFPMRAAVAASTAAESGIRERAASVFYVRKSGNDGNDGLSPATAFLTVQKAVNACTSSGCTVVVGPGTYSETVWIGYRTGTPAGSGTAGSPNTVVGDPTGSRTGDKPGEVRIGSGSYAFYIYRRDHWVLTGLTTASTASFGVYAYNYDGLTIDNCVIEVPRSYGIYTNTGGDTSITDNYFERSRQSGHCTYLYSSSARTGNIDVSGNYMAMTGDDYGASGNGKGRANFSYDYGVIVIDQARGAHQVSITNNIVSDSYLPIYVASYYSDADIRVANNTVAESLYAYYLYAPSATMLVTNNVADNCYYGMYAYARTGGYILGLIEHSIYRRFGRYVQSEEGIIEADPMLTAPAKGDWTPLAESPAIDSGYEKGAPSVDYAGNARPTDGDGDGKAEFDMGAIEFGGEPARKGLRLLQWTEVDPSR